MHIFQSLTWPVHVQTTNLPHLEIMLYPLGHQYIEVSMEYTYANLVLLYIYKCIHRAHTGKINVVANGLANHDFE